jgi:hypothetical protein
MDNDCVEAAELLLWYRASIHAQDWTPTFSPRLADPGMLKDFTYPIFVSIVSNRAYGILTMLVKKNYIPYNQVGDVLLAVTMLRMTEDISKTQSRDLLCDRADQWRRGGYMKRLIHLGASGQLCTSEACLDAFFAVCRELELLLFERFAREA